MGILDSIIYRKYDIIEKQIAAQSNPNPVHLKYRNARLSVRAFQATFALTGVYAVYGCAQLILGKKTD